MSDTANTAITVEIESELMPIVPEFLENRREDCSRIIELLEKGEFKDIYTIGHRMKGAGGSYGFDTISDIGESLEAAVQTGNREAVRRAVDELEVYLGKVSVVYI